MTKLHRSDEEEWGGWWNQHQGAGDQWYDEFYKGADDFTYKSPERKAISEFGEMEGCATPDNHSLMLHELADPKGTGIGNQPANTSYDLQDHREIVAAYDKFLDKWGFRAAFPATEKVVDLAWGRSATTRGRTTWRMRASAMSWTSARSRGGSRRRLRTTRASWITCGISRAIRGRLRRRCCRCGRWRSSGAMCTALGEAATFDLYLLNDTDKAATGTLALYGGVA